MTDQSEIDLALEAFSRFPDGVFELDVSTWTEEDDPVGFIAEVRAMEQFGCTVTVEDKRLVITGPAPIVAAVKEAIILAAREAVAGATLLQFPETVD